MEFYASVFREKDTTAFENIARVPFENSSRSSQSSSVLRSFVFIETKTFRARRNNYRSLIAPQNKARFPIDATKEIVETITRGEGRTTQKTKVLKREVHSHRSHVTATPLLAAD